jgi:hypothetical protein
VKAYQRQLILLFVVMSLLVTVSVFILSTNQVSEPDQPSTDSSFLGEIKLPDAINQSIQGWEGLLEDLNSSRKLFKSRNSS